MLVTDALCAGTLVVFIRTQLGEMVPVPPDAWRSHSNIDRLHKTGLRHADPLTLSHDTFAARGIALFDQHNWAGFFAHADRWPPYEIPASVKLLLNFCEHRKAISEGLPLKKADAIEWFRQNWPAELEEEWPNRNLQDESRSRKEKIKPFVSGLVNVVLNRTERKGGNVPQIIHRDVIARKRRIARGATIGSEFDDGLAVVPDDT
jgi:hypothetical protein